MARAKKRGRKPGRTLNGAVTGSASKNGMGRKEIGYAILSFFGGSVLGAVIGKPSGLVGVAVGGAGVFKKNIYAASIGAGMIFGAGTKAIVASSGTNGISDEEMDGFSMDALKERAKGYFQSLGQRLYLPVPKQEPVNGLNGEEVNYFLNPYTSQNDALDMRELDKVSSQVAQMNGGSMGDFDEDRNF